MTSKQKINLDLEIPNGRVLGDLLVNIADFDTVSVLGEGYHGTVSLVREKKTGEKYASKALKDVYENEKLFKREVENIARFDHYTILKLRGFTEFKANSTQYILTEYFSKGNLNDLIEKESRGLAPEGYDETSKFIIAYGIAYGMSILHNENIIHRDIKPENIFLNDNYQPTIAGFSLSKKIEGTIYLSEQVGSPLFMAPELLELGVDDDKQYSFPVDVYAYAMTLYNLFQYETPFKYLGKMNIFKITNIVLSGERPKFICDTPYKDLIIQCWDQNPENRPSFKEIIKILEQIAEESEFIDLDVFKEYKNKIINKKEDGRNRKKQSKKERKLKKHHSSEAEVNDEENKKLKEKIALLNDEINQLKEKNETSEKENSSLRNEVQKLKKKINKISENDYQQLEEKVKTYGNYLSSLKEKPSELSFFDQDEYVEESVIGEGATSNVKIVLKQEKYAKKELVLFDHKSMQRFLGECEILFKLRHPCIVRVYGFNYGDKTHKPSIILSLEPKSLETAINNKELNEEEKNRIVVEFVLGMRYIHKHKFMHRDLKPLNILLSKNNHVRITDFGLAKEEDLTTSQSKGIGTLRFMAPELFEENNQNYSNKVDVYSFGIILIFIVTDKYPPFSLKNVSIGVLPQLPETVSKWVRELIISCLSPEPENRPSFAEIFEIMKTNNYDLFSDSKDQKMTSKQRKMKEVVERRITKIEAFEFQHQ